jgi:hypothetical protein
VTFHIRQSEADLRDTYCDGVSAARRFRIAFESALHAATAGLGELNLDHRDDLEPFATIAAILHLDESGASAHMPRLYQAQMRSSYDGASPVDLPDADRSLQWAHTSWQRFKISWRIYLPRPRHRRSVTKGS